MLSETREDDIVLVEYDPSMSVVSSIPAQSLPIHSGPDSTSVQLSAQTPSCAASGAMPLEIPLCKDCNWRVAANQPNQSIQDLKASSNDISKQRRLREVEASFPTEVKRNESGDHHLDSRQRLEPVGFNPFSAMPPRGKDQGAGLRNSVALPQPPVSHTVSFVVEATY